MWGLLPTSLSYLDLDRMLIPSGPKLEQVVCASIFEAGIMLGVRLAAVPVASLQPDPTMANLGAGLQLSSVPARRGGDVRSFRQVALGHHLQKRIDARRVTPIVAGGFTDRGTRHAPSDVEVKRIMGEGSYGQVYEVTLPAMRPYNDVKAPTQVLQPSADWLWSCGEPLSALETDHRTGTSCAQSA